MKIEDVTLGQCMEPARYIASDSIHDREFYVCSKHKAEFDTVRNPSLQRDDDLISRLMGQMLLENISHELVSVAIGEKCMLHDLFYADFEEGGRYA